MHLVADNEFACRRWDEFERFYRENFPAVQFESGELLLREADPCYALERWHLRVLRVDSKACPLLADADGRAIPKSWYRRNYIAVIDDDTGIAVATGERLHCLASHKPGDQTGEIPTWADYKSVAFFADKDKPAVGIYFHYTVFEKEPPEIMAHARALKLQAEAIVRLKIGSEIPRELMHAASKIDACDITLRKMYGVKAADLSLAHLVAIMTRGCSRTGEPRRAPYLRVLSKP